MEHEMNDVETPLKNARDQEQYQSRTIQIKIRRQMTLTEKLLTSFRIRNDYIREFLAEFLGTLIFLSLGLASVAQHKLTGQKEFLSVNISFGFGLAIAIITVGKVSGAHLNPAVSLSQLLLGKLSLVKFFIYAVAQFLGAFIAAFFVYVTYLNALRKYSGGAYSLDTAGIFSTYLNNKIEDGNMFLNFFDQFFSTALFIIAILAITDRKNNTEIPHQTVAILIGLALVVIGAAFGHNCGFAVNPARDLAPRLFTAIGWGSKVFTAGNYYFWIPVVGPFVGSIFGTMLYCLFISNHLPQLA